MKAFRRLGYNLTCKVFDLGGVRTRVAQVSGTMRYRIAPPSRTYVPVFPTFKLANASRYMIFIKVIYINFLGCNVD